MKSRKLNEAFNHVDDKFLDLVETRQVKRKPQWVRWVAAAACLCVVVGAVVIPPIFQPVKAVARASYPKHTTHSNEQVVINGDFFDVSMEQFLSDTNGENKLYSPVNVYMALAMLAEVTEGNTRGQILDLLGAEDIDALRTQAGQVWRALYVDDDTTNILANSLWLRDDMSYNRKTTDRLAKDYYASVFTGKMGSAEYNKALQDWLNEQTGGLLKSYSSQEKMGSNTIMALASTVYFRCRWANIFSKNNTAEGVFRGADGTEDVCDFMHQWSNSYYFRADNFGAVRQGMEDNFFMWFLLPDEGKTPEELLVDEQMKQMLHAGWAWENKKNVTVNFALPKFDVSSQMSLSEGLKAMGVTDAFEPGRADYSPLFHGEEEVFLSGTSHAVRVAVDEEGVIAVAYTLMKGDGASPAPEEEIDFTLDRPFLFVITDGNNLPMFMGIVNHP